MNIFASIVDAIMKYMPPGSEKYLTKYDGGGFNVIIHWKISEDTVKPRKYSKALSIDVSRDLIEYVSASSDQVQQNVLLKIGDYVSSKLATFDPNHDSPRGTPKPVENWSLSLEHLLGRK